MKIHECLSRLKAVKPSGIEDETLAEWLTALDRRIYLDITKSYGAEEPPADTDDSHELALPDEYTDVYIYYLSAKIDYLNAETARYLNSMTMFNAALAEFADHYNRSHIMPAKEVKL